MTADHPGIPPPWEPRPAYAQLAATAAEMRPDWSRQELWDAITAARLAGWSYRDIYREVGRLAWAEDETPATLRVAARRPVPAQTGPDVYAHGGELWRAALQEAAARKTGPQPVLAEPSQAHRLAP